MGEHGPSTRQKEGATAIGPLCCPIQLSAYYSALAEATKTLRTEQEGASKGWLSKVRGAANSLVTTLEPAIDLKIGELRKAETKKLSDYQKAWGDYQRDKGALTPTDLSGMTMEQAAAACRRTARP